jgi:hypothetical protein
MSSAEELKRQWQSPDWLQQVTDWIRAETERAGARMTGPIEQPHIYPWSTVLRIPTDLGTLFFKATPPETGYEAALTRALAGWYPECMPEFVAVDEQRAWMLMRDGGTPLRASIRPTKDLAPWNPVISLYSEMQAAATEHVPDLLALGVPDWRLARLPGLFTQLLEDTESFRIDQPDGLTADDFRRVQGLPGRFAEICNDLAAFGIPESVNHGDFHDGNVLVKDGRITLFDWGDGNITHPFVTLRTFFVSIEIALELDDYSFTPEMQVLLQRYLKPWRRFASEADLLAAFPLSRCAATIVKALSWHQTVSRLEGPLRQEYAYIVPALMREFMVYESKLRA